MRGLLKTVTALLVLIAAPAAMADTLDTVLAARPDADKARDQYRHPKETLTFFGITPGMTVIDVLPGDWYGRILAPYLGADGTYIGSAYPNERYKRIFGAERYESRRERIESFETRFPDSVAGYTDTPPATATFRTWNAPEDMHGTVDAYLIIRALHHMNRYGPADMDAAAAEAFKLVKPDGIVGIVQHRAPEGAGDDWAIGSNGYLKQSRVVAAFTGAGFVLEASSDINANPKDQPGEGDFVWRLPPSLAKGETDRAAYQAIGESDRMTLKFRKPS